MKILIIHSQYQLRGGEDTVVEQELQLLRQLHEVEIMYFQNRGSWKGALQFLSSIWNRTAAQKVKQKMQEFQPDVVHIHNWHFALGPLVFRVINELGIPVVHTVHNYRLLCPSGILLRQGKLFTSSLTQPFPWKAVWNQVYRSSAPQTFWLAFVVWFHKKIGTWKKIEVYLCLTTFAVQLFQKSNFGVDQQQFSVKPNFTIAPDSIEQVKRENHFLFIGRLSEEKGIVTLLKAFEELPFQLKIVGEGPLKELVINALAHNSNISYLGNLKKEEIQLELQKTQALIFPSVWYETFGLVTIEAFSNFTPVLASNMGAPKSIVIDKQNGFHFDPANVESLKAVIIRFEGLSLTEKNQMGINAFETYQSKYSPELQLGYFEAIYSKVLRK